VDEGTAEIHRITLAPSVAERKGRFKALLYRDWSPARGGRHGAPSPAGAPP